MITTASDEDEKDEKCHRNERPLKAKNLVSLVLYFNVFHVQQSLSIACSLELAEIWVSGKSSPASSSIKVLVLN